MDKIIGGLGGRLRISITDSTMMWLVNSAMDKAHEKVKSKRGAIEGLHEISKFYELAVMLLEGCLKFVQEETDRNVCESSHGEEEVLAGLTEIRDRLGGRLRETELAISKTDRELAKRLDSELKLRQALEVKEKELNSLRANLEIERTRSEGVEEFILGNRVSVDEDRDGEFCELKHSVDQQVWNIRQKLEPDYKFIDKERNQQGIQNNEIEQMGSDIDVLKHTLDLAFGKMQNAIFLSELGPIEQQWRWTIEKDTISVLIKGFMANIRENFELEARTQEMQVPVGMSKHLSDLMREVTCLRNELDHHSNQTEFQMKNKRSCRASLPSQNNCLRTSGRSLPEVKLIDQENKQEDGRSHYVAKMIKNHESIIRRKSEELNWLKREILKEKECSSSRWDKEPEPGGQKRKMREVINKLDKLIKWNVRLGETFREDDGVENSVEKSSKCDGIHVENSGIDSLEDDSLEDVWGKLNKKSVHLPSIEELQNEIKVLKREKEEANLQTKIMEEIYAIIFEGLINQCYTELYNYNLDNLIRDEMYEQFFEEMVNEWNEKMECNTIQVQTTEEISCIVCVIFLREMLKGWRMEMDDYDNVNLISEDIYRFLVMEAVAEACTIFREVETQKTAQILDSLIKCFKTKKDLILTANSKIKKLKFQADLVRSEDKELDELKVSQELSITSVSSKLDKALEQAIMSNALLIELGSSLGMAVEDPEKVHDQGTPTALLQPGDGGGVKINPYDSIFTSFMVFSRVVVDFEHATQAKLGKNILRLEEVKRQADQLMELVASLTEREFLYRKAFITTCQNLCKAETEVDLLGDQVEVLLGLLEKIYMTLYHSSPVLQWHSEVSYILNLIRKELGGVLAPTCP